MVPFLSEWWHSPRFPHLAWLWHLFCKAEFIALGCIAVSDQVRVFNWSQKQLPSTRRLETCVWFRVHRETHFLFSMACLYLNFIWTMQHITATNCTDKIELPMSHITTEKRQTRPLRHMLQRSLPLAWKCSPCAATRHTRPPRVASTTINILSPSHPEWHPPPSCGSPAPA